MINLSTVTPQVIAPGQSILFDLTTLHTGCAGSHRRGSGIVTLTKTGGAIYNVDFSADVAATAVGAAELSVMLDGEAVPEGGMTSQTAAANARNNVAKPGVKVCVPGRCCSRVSVANTGATTVTVDNVLLSVNRVA